VFFGLQYYLLKYLQGQVVTREKINEAQSFFEDHFGRPDLFNRDGWDHIVTRHRGYLPVVIKAVPEGTSVPTGNVLMTIENTDPAVPWLTNYLETLLSQVWYPTTVATQSRAMKENILTYLERTGTPEQIGFKLHDFGYRGSTSEESAGLGGCAHLVNFLGSDTLAGIVLAKQYYQENMAGFSIPAAEHSTITSWGKEHEVDAFRNMLDQYPTGLVAVVSDSYDIFHACSNLWGKDLRDRVLARDGVVVVRPDSGEPCDTVQKVLYRLGEAFGYMKNAKGYLVLDPHVRVIQGDGIDPEMQDKVYDRITHGGMAWSADNLGFGSGGGLLQKVNRDTCKFAFKCSSIEVNGVWRDVIKTPVTDPGKTSKAGRLILLNEGGQFRTGVEGDGLNRLETVFCNGTVTKVHQFHEVRERSNA